MTGAAEAGHHGDPGEREYVKVAAVLLLLTVAEVAVSNVASLGRLVVPILLVLLASKLALGVLLFMHLRFDSRMSRRLLLLGLAEALFVYTGVPRIFDIWTRNG